MLRFTVSFAGLRSTKNLFRKNLLDGKYDYKSHDDNPLQAKTIIIDTV